ncbi:MAG: hypothetical protein C4527_13060 [Candidatus Omnitrophota bacterium]|nr:MAG: hypothetical protein C4527_13060 [Candidatus Omnitrophota bacterium]
MDRPFDYSCFVCIVSQEFGFPDIFANGKGFYDCTIFRHNITGKKPLIEAGCETRNTRNSCGKKEIFHEI